MSKLATKSIPAGARIKTVAEVAEIAYVGGGEASVLADRRFLCSSQRLVRRQAEAVIHFNVVRIHGERGGVHLQTEAHCIRDGLLGIEFLRSHRRGFRTFRGDRAPLRQLISALRILDKRCSDVCNILLPNGRDAETSADRATQANIVRGPENCSDLEILGRVIILVVLDAAHHGQSERIRDVRLELDICCDVGTVPLARGGDRRKSRESVCADAGIRNLSVDP